MSKIPNIFDYIRELRQNEMLNFNAAVLKTVPIYEANNWPVPTSIQRIYDSFKERT